MGKFLEPTIWNSVISPSFHPGIKSYELMVGWPKSSSGFSITSYSKIKWTFLANPISVHILRGSKHFFAFLFFTVQSLKIMLMNVSQCPFQCSSIISFYLSFFFLFPFTYLLWQNCLVPISPKIESPAAKKFRVRIWDPWLSPVPFFSLAGRVWPKASSMKP